MSQLSSRYSRLVFALCVCLTLGACSDGDNDSLAEFLTISSPDVSMPPNEGAINLLAQNFDLGSVGYEQAEYFIEGTASAFTNLNELGMDGFWEAEPSQQAMYRTRIVVYRPINPDDFNGNVLVEWLNVTAGFETPPSWGTGQLEMRRGGSVWVGASAQLIGIEGSERSLLPLHLKAVNPARYASLMHPGDSYSYDIFSQIAEAIRNPSGIDPLNGLVAERIIAYGESQSASRLTTYVNAIHPLYNTFDGYMIHSRGDGSSSLAQDPLVQLPTPGAVMVRTDLNAPVMIFETETDVVFLGYLNARQPDTDMLKTWEVAGTAHGDYYTFVSGRDDDVGDPIFASVVEERSILGFITCDRPMNNGPHHYVFNTAVRALNEWITSGTQPPESPRLIANDDGTDYVYDALGNATGGIRTPYVDAPSAVLRGEPNEGNSFCGLFGTTSLFGADQMASLYSDQNGYVTAVTEATNAARAEGFLLAEDADAIITWAPQQWTWQTE